MPRGASQIPDLRLSRINKLITSFTAPPSMVFTNLFGSSNAESDQIKWESQTGNRGMTPFVPPGSPAPRHAPQGVAQHSAASAYFKEKMYADEEFLNNLRKEGTESQYLAARARLAKELQTLRNRCDRRKEWMFSKMLVDGSLTYYGRTGVKLSVDYDIPTTHQVSLGTDYKWEAGTKRDILKDVMDAKLTISDDCNGLVNMAVCNSTVLKFMALDDSIQTLLQQSAFPRGDLFKKAGGKIIGANASVIGNLLDLNIVVYDEKYVVEEYLTTAVAASGTTVYVGDAADFQTGTATLHDVSAGTTESVTISAVDREAGTLTIGATTAAFKAGEDKISQTVPFIGNDKFLMFASTVDGQNIAEWMNAPFGLGRHYGMYTDQNDDWDPEGTWIRVQNKGLPVLYQRDAIYVLDVN
jgi:hypothetical protein